MTVGGIGGDGVTWGVRGSGAHKGRPYGVGGSRPRASDAPHKAVAPATQPLCYPRCTPPALGGTRGRITPVPRYPGQDRLVM